MTTKSKKAKARMWAVVDASGIRSVEASRRLARDFAGDMAAPCRVVKVQVREV